MKTMSNDHLDADTLVALSENVVNKKEAASLFAHLAVCEDCRDWIRIHAQLKDFCWSEPLPRRMPSSFLAAAGIACACVIFAFAGIWLGVSHVPAVPSLSESSSAPPSAARPILITNKQRRTTGSRNFTFTLEPVSRDVALPGPFALTRLNNEVTFAFTTGHTRANNQIALKTPLGERWIALDLVDYQFAAR